MVLLGEFNDELSFPNNLACLMCFFLLKSVVICCGAFL